VRAFKVDEIDGRNTDRSGHKMCKWTKQTLSWQRRCLHVPSKLSSEESREVEPLSKQVFRSFRWNEIDTLNSQTNMYALDVRLRM
jgi:hypothetical protein